MPVVPEKSKEGGSKKKFWNERKGKSSQEPSKKQQTVAIYTTIVPTGVLTQHLQPFLLHQQPRVVMLELCQSTIHETSITRDFLGK